MSNKLNQENYYQERLKELYIERKKFSNRAKRWVFIRLFSFLLIPVTVYFAFPLGGLAALLLVAVTVLFLFFVRKSAENKEKLNYVKNLITLNDNELKALQGDYSGFGDGSDWIDPNHAFSYDMDLFGKNSFFQLFNRTVTQRGEEYLVHRLLSGTKRITETNETVEELRNHMDWTQRFRAHAMGLEKEQTNMVIAQWANESVINRSWIRIFQWIIPVIAFTLTFLYYFDVIPGVVFGTSLLILLLPVRQLLRETNRMHGQLSRMGPAVSAMKEQLEIFQEITFESEILKEYQHALFHGGMNGKLAVGRLKTLVKEAEYRNNILVAILLNLYFAWDLRLITNVDRWKSEFGREMKVWENIVYELEGLISAAVFRFNFEDQTSYARILSDKNGSIKLERVGHPIIPADKVVRNDFDLSEQERFAIITGPNMAGKSTFLRSVGINLMLARAGFPVMAQRFEFPDMHLYSSMRTSDNLSDETSYFHAELLRLRFIMNAIERGEPVFIILDEILKGTNSKDKEEGSARFLRKLSQKGARGIIATHDLSLTELAKSNEEMVNLYFDTTIEGDDISFDYVMREGVAKNMNASFLLKKMGLTD
ncbi:MAG: hypothetical protein R3277_09065 [Brumimicrobium sp.]|nr:hypothetical protein [Brumimicrobium sp.]